MASLWDDDSKPRRPTRPAKLLWLGRCAANMNVSKDSEVIACVVFGASIETIGLYD